MPPEPTPTPDAEEVQELIADTKPANTTGNTPETYSDDQEATPYDRLRNLLVARQQAIEAGNRDRLRELNRRIERLLANHPNNDKLVEEAEDAGFNVPERPRPGAETDESGGGTSGPGGGGGSNRPGSGSGGGGGGGGGASIEPNRFLPGIKGKDFTVVRFGDRTYVSYFIKVGGRKVNVSWRVPDDKKKQWGIGENEGRELTRAQFKRLNYFGKADRITVHGEQRHPFAAWKEEVAAQYGGTGLLKNKEVMSILLMGYTENWSQESIKGAIRQTKWWQNTTAYSRRWNFELTDQEKETTLRSTETQMRETLQALYGDKWAQHVEPGQLGDMAQRIASGRFGMEGNPEDAFNLWKTRQQNQAEKVMGTPAQVAADEANQQVANSMANPKNMAAALRDRAGAALGYHAIPAGDVIDRWANQLAAGIKGQEDFDAWLGKQKSSLYDFLDENESWVDRASVYKGFYERLTGQTIGFDHRVLMNLQATDASGKAISGQAKSLYDFEKEIRSTDTYWNSRNAALEGEGIVNLIEKQFGKVA